MSATPAPIGAAGPGGAPVAMPEVKEIGLLRRVLRRPTAAVAAAFLALVFLMALIGGWIAPFNPNKTAPLDVLAGPGHNHWLGTDSAGRDVLSRLLAGTRVTIFAALLAVLIAAVIGITGGLIAGYFGKWFDTVASWLTSLLMALPGIVVLLAARSVLGPSTWTAMMVFGVLMAPAFFRLVHVTVRGVRNELYVDAARVSGLGDWRIIGRHILGVVKAPIVIQAAIIASIALAIQSGLAVIFGASKEPTWGSMLADGFKALFRQGWLLVWPSVALVLTTIALAVLANALRDEFDGARRAPDVANPDQLVAGPADTIVHGPPSDAVPLLTVTNLSVGYPAGRGWTRVVEDVSLTVGRGEVVGLVGESGSGKTQTAFAVMGLLPTTGKVLGGSIVFDGTELVGAPAATTARLRGKRIAYIPQEPMSNLDPSFTIGSQLVEPIRVCLGLSTHDARRRALELLAKVGIPDPPRTFASYPHEVSGGMAQRVLIAGAVSCDPDLIIADEPTTALDVTVQAEILELLRRLQIETQTALLLVTHNFGVVADLCDRVSVMQHGRLVESGPVRAIFREAAHPYTRSLLDAILEDAPPRGAYVPVEVAS